MKKELIFLGPPACGKGTQTAKLSEYLNFPHVDTGSLLRAEIKGETEAGKEAKAYIDKGQLVPVELVTRIIKNRLSQDDCKNGYILDGFPRSVEQAEELEKMNEEIDKDGAASFKAIYFDIDTSVLVERIVNRRSCPKCGEIYNLAFKAPKEEGICDKCGGELYQREDQKPEVVQNRLEVYSKTAEELINYYKNANVLVSKKAGDKAGKTSYDVAREIEETLNK